LRYHNRKTWSSTCQISPRFVPRQKQKGSCSLRFHAFRNSSVELTLAVHIFNVGHEMLSRNVFAEIATDASKEHSFVSLNESYRSLGELFDFPRQFYSGGLRPGRFKTKIEADLQDTLKAYWNTQTSALAHGLRFISMSLVSILSSLVLRPRAIQPRPRLSHGLSKTCLISFPPRRHQEESGPLTSA
jgi:hypothetical protein